MLKYCFVNCYFGSLWESDDLHHDLAHVCAFLIKVGIFIENKSGKIDFDTTYFFNQNIETNNRICFFFGSKVHLIKKLSLADIAGSFSVVYKIIILVLLVLYQNIVNLSTS